MVDPFQNIRPLPVGSPNCQLSRRPKSTSYANMYAHDAISQLSRWKFWQRDVTYGSVIIRKGCVKRAGRRTRCKANSTQPLSDRDGPRWARGAENITQILATPSNGLNSVNCWADQSGAVEVAAAARHNLRCGRAVECERADLRECAHTQLSLRSPPER